MLYAIIVQSISLINYAFLYSNKLGTKELKSPQTPPLFASTKRIRNVTVKGEVKPSSRTNITIVPEVEDDEPAAAPRRRTRRRTDVVATSISSSEIITKPSSKIYYERQGFTTRDDVKEQR